MSRLATEILVLFMTVVSGACLAAVLGMLPEEPRDDA